MQYISIRGARTHNLRNVDLDLPRDKLIVITGLSGSGKSSLAFDTIYAEGQRRYVESLSAYARQFLSMMDKPDVDHIEGLSPAISIEQKTASHNPRSTVGTVTEIYDYLRLLFARAGTPRCPDHNRDLRAQTVSQMVDQALSLPEGTRLVLLAPVVQARKGEHTQLLADLRSQGYVRARIDGEICELDDPPKLDLRRKHTIEVVVDRFKVRDDIKQRLAESFETALKLADGVAKVAPMEGNDKAALAALASMMGGAEAIFSDRFACPICSFSISELEPRLFSFNNPAGACAACDGLGVKQFFDEDRVVRYPDLSLAGGAIRGWDRRNAYYFSMIQSLAKHYDFDIELSWKKLPARIQKILLHGSGEEKIQFNYLTGHGVSINRKHKFEGILPNLERRYRETDSGMVREELARFLSTHPCPDCKGTRLNTAARNVFVSGKSIPEVTTMSVGHALEFFGALNLEGWRGEIASKVVKEIQNRLKFLADVGLEYLSLDRSAETLSGGEAQRIRLASQIGSGLVGVMYILDEPSIGLHQRDNKRLLNTLIHLRDIGNTVMVVEHDEEAIAASDHVVDLGPGAGVHGGQIVAQGTPAEIMAHPTSITGQYLSGRRQVPVPKRRRAADDSRWLTIRGARGNNLKDLNVRIPLGVMTCVTGVSGSGKSTLVNDTLYLFTAEKLNGQSETPHAPCDRIDGLDSVDRVIDISQSPIGRTPRSNPATYTGLFTPIRELFAGTQEARSRGYKAGRFSFNVKGGRCEECQGDGVLKVEMHFLPDIYVPCDVCKGQRYNRETLEIRYKARNINDVLEMTVEDALPFFSAIPMIAPKLQTLMEVGLSYVRLGQNATTLSGGEAQRVKLAKELSKRATGNTLYILDEPTTGLHFHDIAQLLVVLQKLRDQGNTIVVIEHNLDVIKTADWIVDLGPEGGNGGGHVVAEGTPEDVANNGKSYTGQYLAPLLRHVRVRLHSCRMKTAPSSDLCRAVGHLDALVGRTPLVEIHYRCNGQPRRIYAKYESMNMTGSVKDRMALHILRRAAERGDLQAGAVIVEASSGNTGISFAAIGRALGHRVRIYMPDWMSLERTQLMHGLGADVVPVSKAQGGFVGSVRMTEEYAKENPRAFLPCQFTNPDNAEAHELTTGPEIEAQLAQLGRQADAFVAGVGTGGTVMGVGRALRGKGRNVRIHPLEPANSPTLRTGKKVGSHRIQGISDEFIPEIVKLDQLDAIVDVWDGDAILMAQSLGHRLGLAMGISSGANVVGAMKLVEELGPEATVVTVLCDSNKKYLSTALPQAEPPHNDYMTPQVQLQSFISVR